MSASLMYLVQVVLDQVEVLEQVVLEQVAAWSRWSWSRWSWSRWWPGAGGGLEQVEVLISQHRIRVIRTSEPIS